MRTVLEEIKQANPHIDEAFNEFLSHNFTDEQLAEIKKTITYDSENHSVCWKDGQDSVKVSYDSNGQLKKFRAVNENNGDFYKIRYSDSGKTLKAEESSVEHSKEGRTKETTKLRMKKDQTTYHYKMVQLSTPHHHIQRDSSSVKAVLDNNSGSGYVAQKTSKLTAYPHTVLYENTKEKTHFSNQNIVEKSSHKKTSTEIGLLSGISLSVSKQKKSPEKETSNNFSVNFNPLYASTGFKQAHSTTLKNENGSVTRSYEVGTQISVSAKKLLNLTSSVDAHFSREKSAHDAEGKLLYENKEKIGASVYITPLSAKVSYAGRQQSTDENGQTTTSSVSGQAEFYQGLIGGIGRGVSLRGEKSVVTKNAEGKLLDEQKDELSAIAATHKIGFKQNHSTNDGTTKTTTSSAYVAGGRKLFEWKNKETETHKKPDNNSSVTQTKESSEQQQMYKHAEIKHIQNKDGQSRQFAEIDGKKHGADITFDENGQITQVDLYDKGVKIELHENDKVDLLQTSDENGKTSSVLFNGKPYGTTIFQDNNGQIQAEFYDLNGKIPPAENASLVLNVTDNRQQNTISKEALKQQMLTDAQKAHAPTGFSETKQNNNDSKTQTAMILQKQKQFAGR